MKKKAEERGHYPLQGVNGIWHNGDCLLDSLRTKAALSYLSFHNTKLHRTAFEIHVLYRAAGYKSLRDKVGKRRMSFRLL